MRHTAPAVRHHVVTQRAAGSATPHRSSGDCGEPRPAWPRSRAVGLVRPSPGKTRIIAAEVAVCRRAPVGRPPQTQPGHQGARPRGAGNDPSLLPSHSATHSVASSTPAPPTSRHPIPGPPDDTSHPRAQRLHRAELTTPRFERSACGRLAPLHNSQARRIGDRELRDLVDLSRCVIGARHERRARSRLPGGFRRIVRRVRAARGGSLCALPMTCLPCPGRNSG
jgi:hypothetical protein